MFTRQTSRADVRILGKVHIMVQLQDSNVIVQSSSVEFRMNVHTDDVPFDVREELYVMVDIPFPESYPEVSALVGLDAVSCGDDVTR